MYQFMDKAILTCGVSLIDTAEQYPIPADGKKGVLEGDTERQVGEWMVKHETRWSLPPKLLVDEISHCRIYVKIVMVAYHDYSLIILIYTNFIGQHDILPNQIGVNHYHLMKYVCQCNH
jgi:hypothetical protein